MKRLSFLLFIASFVSLSGASCRKSAIASNIPSCIRNEIQAQIDDPQSNVVKVNEYMFQGKTVYGFDHFMAADGTMEIKDGDCNTLCYVGGFGGPNVNLCNGENFFQHAVFKRNVWTRP
jgi:hypothetical protein